MRRCTLEEVARYSGGRLLRGDPHLSVDRLHTDTRTLHEGDCFVALRGDRFDGHTFVNQVRGRGAVAALVSERPNIADLPDDLGLVEVPDTLEALQRFAAEYRRSLSARVVGVTGSSGKTSSRSRTSASPMIPSGTSGFSACRRPTMARSGSGAPRASSWAFKRSRSRPRRFQCDQRSHFRWFGVGDRATSSSDYSCRRWLWPRSYLRRPAPSRTTCAPACSARVGRNA